MVNTPRSSAEIELTKAVGGRLKEVRTFLGISQKALVESLGIGTQKSISNYESGENLPPVDLVHRICEVFDVSFDWLMTGRGTMSQDDPQKWMTPREKENIEAKRRELYEILESAIKKGVEIEVALRDRILGKRKLKSLPDSGARRLDQPGSGKAEKKPS